MKISVLIVSYQRSRLLNNCLGALARQSRLPDEVVVVGVENDRETRAVVESFAASSRFPCLWRSTAKAGVIYQTNAGLACCDGDVLVFTNDDAEPYTDWLERLEPYYNDPTIGGVGGRDIIHVGEGRLLHGQAPCVGRITWYGRVHGNHHLDYHQTVDVDVLKGVNMSCRRELLGSLDLRMVPLGPVHHWELDACLQIRRRGKRLIYDPLIVVDHFHGTRPRLPDPDFVYMANYNLTLNLAKNMKPWRRLMFLVYAFLWGDFPEMGLAVFGAVYLRRLVRHRDAAFVRYLGPSLQGKLDAVRSLRTPEEMTGQPQAWQAEASGES